MGKIDYKFSMMNVQCLQVSYTFDLPTGEVKTDIRFDFAADGSNFVNLVQNKKPKVFEATGIFDRDKSELKTGDNKKEEL